LARPVVGADAALAAEARTRAIAAEAEAGSRAILDAARQVTLARAIAVRVETAQRAGLLSAMR
jgi:hypothetical protein